MTHSKPASSGQADGRIIPADQHVTAARGAKLLLLGLPGVGKTSELRTLNLKETLFVDREAGDLAVQDIAVDTLRPRTWPDWRDFAVTLAGADPAVSAASCYSAEHHIAVAGQFDNLKRYKTVFVDSLTAAGRDCFAWSCQQPEAFSDRSGKRDLRGAYGLHAREMLAWLLHLQQARSTNIILVGILETVTDDFNRTEHRLQFEGARTGRELPAIVDQVITYSWIPMGEDGAPTRAFVCTTPNPWQYPAKDRSGRLDQLEEPHLGKLLDKLTKPRAAASSQPQPPTQAKGESK